MFLRRLGRTLRKRGDLVVRMSRRGASDISREMLVTATQIICAFAFGLLLLPKELAAAGHLWDHRDRDKEWGGGSGGAPSARGT